MEAKPEDFAAEAAQIAQIVNDIVKTSETSGRKMMKDGKKTKEESGEQLQKILVNYHTPEEKLNAITKKYVEALDENKRYQVLTKQWEKRYILLQREKDQTQSEYNKAILLKSKLENLCRELQKQIKVVKEESLLKIKEEEEKRKETLAIFQNTITELTTAVQHNNEKNNKLRDANIDMKEKFKSVMEQYELREHHVDKITKQMSLETQLSEAKLAKANLEAQADKEKLLGEKKQLLLELTQYQARCNDLQQAEIALRSQISMYTDKCDEFQSALTKSSEVFGSFKGEMEKMAKKGDKQEKEASAWRQRWEKTNSTLINLASEKQKVDSLYGLQGRQFARLERLCRIMQAERTVLIDTLKEHNIERPPLSQLPEVHEGPDKVDLMAANCAQLKQSLSQLQGQLNDLTARKKKTDNAITENTNDTQKKGKKGKGKKTKVVDNQSSKDNQSEDTAASETKVPQIKNDETETIKEKVSDDNVINEKTSEDNVVNVVINEKTSEDNIINEKTLEDNVVNEKILEDIVINEKTSEDNVINEKTSEINVVNEKDLVTKEVIPESVINNVPISNGNIINKDEESSLHSHNTNEDKNVQLPESAS